MRNAVKNLIKENMHALLECIFVDHANLLWANYPDRTIRNAAVFVSGVPEFARPGLIELVDARTGIRDGIPDFVVRTIKRAKHQPIWIPGVNSAPGAAGSRRGRSWSSIYCGASP